MFGVDLVVDFEKQWVLDPEYYGGDRKLYTEVQNLADEYLDTNDTIVWLTYDMFDKFKGKYPAIKQIMLDNNVTMCLVVLHW